MMCVVVHSSYLSGDVFSGLFVLFCSFCFCSYSEKNWELLTKNRRTSGLTS